jgi:DnaJ-class molecular chaperone
MKPCWMCWGDGQIPDVGVGRKSRKVVCPTCKGTGSVPLSDAEREQAGQSSLLEGLS